MRHASRCATALTAMVAAMAVAAGVAQANRFEFSSQTFRFFSNVFTFTENTGRASVICRVTLEGSFHSRSFVKANNNLIGYITRAEVAGCERGGAGFLTERLPWNIQYEGFIGALPNIERINIRATEIPIWIRTGFIFSCLGTSSAVSPVRFWLGRVPGESTISAIAPRSEATIPIEGATCGGTVSLSGPSEMTVLGAATRVRLLLI